MYNTRIEVLNFNDSIKEIIDFNGINEEISKNNIKKFPRGIVNVKHIKSNSKDGKTYGLLIANEDNTNHLFFSIKNFFKYKDRIIVIIFSYDPEKKELLKHFYYKSKSELGIWRYCLYNRSVGFDQGYNYVSTTSINIFIQKFLDQNLKNFIIKDYDKEKPTDFCPELITDKVLKDAKNGIENILVERVSDFMYNVKYLSPEPFFNAIDLILKVDSTYSKLDEIHNNKLFNIAMGRIENDFQEDVKDFLKELEYNKIQKINKCYLDELYKTLIIKNIIISELEKNIKGLTSKTKIYMTINKIVEKLFKGYFTIKPPEILYIKEEKFKITDTESINFKIAIYQRKIKNKFNTGYDFTINYMFYKYQDNYYNNIIQIVPIENNSILSYGLDKQYVTAGIMINKPFDYIKQVGHTRTPEDVRISPSNYNFIGKYANYSFLKFDFKDVNSDFYPNFSIFDIIKKKEDPAKTDHYLNKKTKEMKNVSLILFNREGNKIFVVYQGSKGKIKMSPPGGKIERGEKSFNAVKREFKEETGNRDLPECINFKSNRGFTMFYSDDAESTETYSTKLFVGICKESEVSWKSGGSETIGGEWIKLDSINEKYIKNEFVSYSYKTLLKFFDLIVKDMVN